MFGSDTDSMDRVNEYQPVIAKVVPNSDIGAICQLFVYSNYVLQIFTVHCTFIVLVPHYHDQIDLNSINSDQIVSPFVFTNRFRASHGEVVGPAMGPASW